MKRALAFLFDAAAASSIGWVIGKICGAIVLYFLLAGCASGRSYQAKSWNYRTNQWEHYKCRGERCDRSER